MDQHTMKVSDLYDIAILISRVTVNSGENIWSFSAREFISFDF